VISEDWLAIWDAADEADRAAALAHVTTRLQAECDREVARGMTSCVRPVTVQVIDAERRGDRLIATTCGWYRLYFQSISGSDWSTRYIAVDEIGVERGVVMGARSVATVEGGMGENDSDDHELADKLDADHVAEVIASFRDREARMSGLNG